MTVTLAQLLTPQTPQQVFQTLLSLYQAAGFPTTAWQPFGVERTRLMAYATAMSDFSTNITPAVAGGSLLDYAPNYPGWMSLTAQEIFGFPGGNNPATYTQGYILATNTSGTAYTFSPTSQLIAAFSASGNRYFSQGSGTIPANGSLLILFQAENPGALYADPSNVGSTGLTLVTPLAGVTLNNPASNFSTPTHIGSGTGTIALSGSPIGAHSIVLSVTSTSTGNPVTISYSVDGATAIALGAVSSVTNLGGLGVNVTFTVGASGTSWVNGDSYSFSFPAPWITSQGANAETDTALAARCRNRWASLASVPTQGLYQLLAQSTPAVGAQVTQAFVVPDATINNKINIVVAGPGGVLPPATIALIQAFITPWARGTDNPVVQSPTTTPVTIAATITGAASQLATIQGAAATALNNYIASLSVNPTIKISVIDSSIVPNPVTGVGGIQGVTDISGITINGVAANLALGGPGVYVLPAYPPTLNLSYIGQ